jgi:homocysteine S-methyltransferase
MCDQNERGFILSPNLGELLDRRVLIGDGAVGTLLGERGVGFGHPYARANLSHPRMVTEIHEEYLRAGADVIETNTFAANRFKLEIHDLEDRVSDVNARGEVRSGRRGPGARPRGRRSPGAPARARRPRQPR